VTSSNDVFGDSWAGRRVAVVGLGRSGLAAAELLCRAGARVCATEARDTPALRQAAGALTALGADTIELGGHTKQLIEAAEVVIVSPGVPEADGPVAWALEQGRPVLSEIELAFRFCRSPIIAVTGTNGKSTAVTSIVELLRAVRREAIACGNLGTPFSSIIEQLTPQTTVVLEVSSFQLLWCDAFRPHLGVLLNIGVNHLDRHRDPDAYLAAKSRLFRRQTPEDWAVLNGADPRIAAVGESLVSRRVWFGDNRSNPPRFHVAAETQRAFSQRDQAILQVGRILGIPDPLSWQVMRQFHGLEHRLEPVAVMRRGIRFINDSKSTTPDSLLFALRQTPGELIVILGGRDKGMDFAPLVQPLHEARIQEIVLIGESRSRLRNLLNGIPNPPVIEEATLEQAVQSAAELARPGTTILFSPACASFDMFKDFEDRGRAFKAIVHRLADRG